MLLSTAITFSDDGNGGPLPGLDLTELPLEVARGEHVHGECGHLLKDDAVLTGLAVVLTDLLRLSSSSPSSDALLSHLCQAPCIILRHVR